MINDEAWRCCYFIIRDSSFVRHLNIPMFGFRIFGRHLVAGSQNDRLAARWPDADHRQFRPSQS